MSRPPTAHGSAGAAPEYSRRDLQGHKHNVCAVAWASSGKRLASASEDGVVKLWTIEHSSTVRKEERWEQELVHGSKDHVVALAFHPKKDELLAVVGANVTKVYDLRSKSATVMCQAPTPDAIAAAWDGRDSLLVAQLHNTFTHIEVRRKRTHRPTIMREGDEVTGLVFIEGGHKLLVATRFGAEVWSWPAWQKLAVLNGHSLHHGRDGGVTAMAVGRGDRLLATGGMDAQVVLWDLPSATPVKAVYLPDQAVRALSLSADLAMVAYCQDAAPGQACSLDVVSTTTGSYLYRVLLAKPTESLAFNPRYPNMAAFAAETAVSASGSGRDSYSRDAKPKEVLAGKVGILVFGK